ncbi:Threonylcarbamoyl-AMP synthase [Planctomycetes bacterium CA13]|uniref:Threonylcarbamoyl-AMP synthase n=1 Tax=Novipirellula herctigrandis TaxID=2527986 RepID=A0A5C5YWF6_9BACT|nr:Threonylcarbamoyl-AMP synthase [Planctomycetes bacterium CA13]
MPRIALPTSENLDWACELLSVGELVAIPTETVYGLAANAWDADAVMKIFAAKGRPANNPLIVHVASIDRMGEACAMPLAKPIQTQLNAISDLWPGPMTVVLPRHSRIPDCVTAGLDTVAVRIPSHPVALELLKRCPFPIAAPSANRSNYISPTAAEHCQSGLGESVSLILDGGACPFGVESTIIALEPEGPRLLRPGGISAEALSRRFDISLSQLTRKRGQADRIEAPGMMREHYSPSKPLLLLFAPPAERVPPHTGRIAFGPIAAEEAARYEVVEVLSETTDLAEVARNLFAALRRMDQAAVQAIHVDTCQSVGVGRAIMDRLGRAAARDSS